MPSLSEYIQDKDILWLLGKIVASYNTEANHDVGLPLGNLTSQLLSNVFINQFDWWVKHKLKAKNYIRYADDFVFISTDKKWLESIISRVHDFLSERLKLTLHPEKIFLKTLVSGVDFLGWVHFSDHRILRTKTRKNS